VIWDVYSDGVLIGRGVWRHEGFQSASGSVLHLPAGAAVRPWHPVEGTADERRQWQHLVVLERIAQPIRQAFREWYVVPERELDQDATSMFEGLIVSARQFIGLARREGWKADYTSMRRESLDGWGFELQTDDKLYPGAEGPRRLGMLRARRFGEGGWNPSKLRDVPTVVLSEALRSADLLASTAAYALDADDPARIRDRSRLDSCPVTGQTAARRIALELVLANVDGSDRISFGDRHLTVRGPSGDYRIHYGTGFVVEPSGEVLPPNDDPPLAATPLPWLPYDEALLERVVRQTLTLLGSLDK
jgi:hypothetical protein